jgi:hypothetical protein
MRGIKVTKRAQGEDDVYSVDIFVLYAKVLERALRLIHIPLGGDSAPS